MKCGWAVVFCVFVCTPLAAETWTDSTGRFQIDAQLKSIEGTNVVLLKPDGRTVTVPLEKLSPQSRIQAQEAFAALSPAAAAAPQQAKKFTLPERLPTEPMAAFPEDASLQETVGFVISQIRAGHPEVLWYAFPKDAREALDSQAHRDNISVDLKLRPHTRALYADVSLKLAELLDTQKTFVLNSGLFQEVGKDYLPLVQNSYDPAVGLFYECTRLMSGELDIQNNTVTQIVDYHGPRIGGYLKALLATLPANVLDEMIAGIEVEMHDSTSGILRVSNIPGAGNVELEMVTFQGRWVTKSYAERWPGFKQRIANGQTGLAESPPLTEEQHKFFDEMMKDIHDGVDKLLDPLLEADTQEEFDAALSKLMVQAAAAGKVFSPGG